jgi:hypothetical protein
MIRIMIGLLLAGSAFLGWQATQQRETIARYEAAVAEGGAAEKLAQRILRSAFSYTQYKERSAKEGVKGDGADQVNSYIFAIAANPKVLWGNPKIEKPRDSSPLLQEALMELDEENQRLELELDAASTPAGGR